MSDLHSLYFKIKVFLCIAVIGITANAQAGPNLGSPEDVLNCFPCCDENGNSVPSHSVCGCGPVNSCGLCSPDESLCKPSCELFDCKGAPIANSENFCHLDVNGDSHIDRKDFELIRDTINARGFEKTFDTNGDGSLTGQDSLLIWNFVNGPESGQSCDETPTPTPTITPTITPTPTPDCTYQVAVTRIDLDTNGQQAFSGDFGKLSCLDNEIRSITSGRAGASSLEAKFYRAFGAEPDDRNVARLLFQLAERGGVRGPNGNLQTQAIGETVVRYLDANCNLLNAIPNGHQICGGFNFRWSDTPISLIWENDVDIEDIGTVTKFRINPTEDGWYAWRGSDKTPLLVYDPENSGKIDSAYKLLGSYTAGGKSINSIKNTSLSSLDKSLDDSVNRWEDGFEALSKFDANSDGVVSGEELASLGLWFDKNQNAISEKGEVVKLSEAGVIELRYTNTQKDQFGNVKLSLGYTVLENGKFRKGDLVDWNSKSYPTSQAALEALNMRSLITTSKGISSKNTISSDDFLEVSPVQSSSDYLAKSKEEGVSGLWKWELIDKDYDSVSKSGVFFFIQKGSKIAGHSVFEVPLDDPSKKIKGLRVASPITGQMEEGTGDQLSFVIRPGNRDIVTSSSAVVSDNGNTLIGTSQVNDKSGNGASYRWKAVRLH